MSEVSRLQELTRGTFAQYFEVSRGGSFKFEREKKIPIFEREKIADQGQVSPTRTMRRDSGVPAGTDGIDRRAGASRARNRREKERQRRGSSAKGIGRASGVGGPTGLHVESLADPHPVLAIRRQPRYRVRPRVSRAVHFSSSLRVARSNRSYIVTIEKAAIKFRHYPSIRLTGAWEKIIKICTSEIYNYIYIDLKKKRSFTQTDSLMS